MLRLSLLAFAALALGSGLQAGQVLAFTEQETQSFLLLLSDLEVAMKAPGGPSASDFTAVDAVVDAAKQGDYTTTAVPWWQDKGRPGRDARLLAAAVASMSALRAEAAFPLTADIAQTSLVHRSRLLAGEGSFEEPTLYRLVDQYIDARQDREEKRFYDALDLRAAELLGEARLRFKERLAETLNATIKEVRAICSPQAHSHEEDSTATDASPTMAAAAVCPTELLEELLELKDEELVAQMIPKVSRLLLRHPHTAMHPHVHSIHEYFDADDFVAIGRTAYEWTALLAIVADRRPRGEALGLVSPLAMACQLLMAELELGFSSGPVRWSSAARAALSDLVATASSRQLQSRQAILADIADTILKALSGEEQPWSVGSLRFWHPWDLEQLTVPDSLLETVRRVVTRNLALADYRASVRSLQLAALPVCASVDEERCLQEDTPDGFVDCASAVYDTLTAAIESSANSWSRSWRRFDFDLIMRLSGEKMHFDLSFVTWSGERYRSSLASLLAGESVTLRAEVSNGPPRLNAVKFSQIRLLLWHPQERLNLELQEALKDFEVSLVHNGTSHFKCSDGVLAVSHGVVYATSQGDANSSVTTENGDDLSDGEAMVSPYALWTVQLRPLPDSTDSSFSHLARFAEGMRASLVGYGSFVDGEVQCGRCAELGSFTPNEPFVDD